MEAKEREVFRLRFDGARQRLQLRIDRFEKSMTIISQLHRLTRTGEQFLADEILEIADPPRKGRRA